jgi:hypothetical protein
LGLFEVGARQVGGGSHAECSSTDAAAGTGAVMVVGEVMPSAPQQVPRLGRVP